MSPSQASETCASASSATSAKVKIIASQMLSVNFAFRSRLQWPPRQPAISEITLLRDSFLS